MCYKVRYKYQIIQSRDIYIHKENLYLYKLHIKLPQKKHFSPVNIRRKLIHVHTLHKIYILLSSCIFPLFKISVSKVSDSTAQLPNICCFVFLKSNKHNLNRKFYLINKINQIQYIKKNLLLNKFSGSNHVYFV